MKRFINLNFLACSSRTLGKEVCQIVEPEIPKSLLPWYSFPNQIPFYENSPLLQLAIKMSKDAGYQPKMYTHVEYTKKELESVEFFKMIPSVPLELEGTVPADYGTIYKGGCPVCQLGAVPDGDILVAGKFFKNKQICFIPPDIVVSGAVRDHLLQSDLTGFHFGNRVRDYKNRPMGEFVRWEIDSILPPMSRTAWLHPYEFREYECEHNIIYQHSEPQYEKEKMENAKDINLSCEYLDNFRMQNLIISRKAKEFFKSIGVRAHYEPVTLL